MSPTTRGTTCREAMERVHQVLDGDLMDATDRSAMESHLVVCADCSEVASQLREMQDLLRGHAEKPMPEETLQEVWTQTIRSPASAASSRRFDWRFAAAAAVVGLVAWIGIRGWSPPVTPNEEALRAAHDVRMVLQLTANALKRSEEVAIRQVFTEEISPALRKIGVRFPQASVAARGDGAEL